MQGLASTLVTEYLLSPCSPLDFFGSPRSPILQPVSNKEHTGSLGISSRKGPKENKICGSYTLISAMTGRGHHILCFHVVTAKDTPLNQDPRNGERFHPITPPKQLSSNPAVSNSLYALQHHFPEFSSHNSAASCTINLSGNMPLAHVAVFPSHLSHGLKIHLFIFFYFPTYLICSHEVI